MERERVARFSAQKSTAKSFIDTRIAGHERDIFQVIGNGVNEDPAHKPAITDHRDFSVGIISAEHGKGASLHIHETIEMFMPLDGKWAIYWLDDKGEQQEVILEKHDVVSVPSGVWRGFRNESGCPALLFAINGGTDPGRVTWPQSMIEAAQKAGLKLSPEGDLYEVSPATN
jgi:mannose-6-phosphate isomerase-like protein (cupin superfamily)